METSFSALDANPAALYTSRLGELRAAIARLRGRHRQLAYLRLLWAVLFLALAWFAWGAKAIAWPWLLLPWLGFALTAYAHARVIAAEARSRRTAAWCEHGLARIQDRWAGVQPRPAPVDVSASLYAADLDLFTPAGLFELLCAARTQTGEHRLAAWLLDAAPEETLRARQAAVAELGPRSALREAWAGVPGPLVIPLEPEPLLRWAEATEARMPRALGFVAPLLAVCTAGAAIFWATAHVYAPLVAVLLVNLALHLYWQRGLQPVFAKAQAAAALLSPLPDLLALLEQETFATPQLQAMVASLNATEGPASDSLRTLVRLAASIEQRGAVRLLDIPFLLSLQLGLAADRWRATHGRHLRAWLDTLAEFEALLSLAAYHFEHPADPFPEIGGDAPSFVAEELGHPLLAQAACVRNSLTLDEKTRLLLVSGSNMSGKSTLLRSVGVATIMAMAGAPVRARQLRLTPVHIGASIQVSDSLQAGHSRFYAEILRLRAVCELARKQPPALFLLDELLAGTNSHDRQAGASGIVEALLTSGAIGLLSTHDLALTAIEGGHAHLIRNAHFEDTITDDRIAFDYTLREGVVERSNGLALMRLVGLDV